MSDSEVSEWQQEDAWREGDYDSADEDFAAGGSAMGGSSGATAQPAPANIPLAAPTAPPQQPSFNKGPSSSEQKPKKKQRQRPPPPPSNATPGTDLDLGDVYDFKVSHEADLEKQILLSSLSLGQREAVLYGKLNSPERQRSILGFVLDWAISYGNHPCLWAVTDDGWYRLMYPAKSYYDMFKGMQRKLDLCTRALAALQFGAPDEEDRAGASILGGVTSILHSDHAVGTGKGGTYSGKAPVKYSPDDVVEHMPFVVAQLRAVARHQVVPEKADQASWFASALARWSDKLELPKEPHSRAPEPKKEEGILGSSARETAMQEAQLEPRADAPPPPEEVGGVPSEELSLSLQIWDFFQVFCGVLELPFFSLNQLLEALGHEFDEEDANEMIHSEKAKVQQEHAFLLTALHSVLLKVYGRDGHQSYAQLCQQSGTAPLDVARLVTWPETMWALFSTLVQAGGGSATSPSQLGQKQKGWGEGVGAGVDANELAAVSERASKVGYWRLSRRDKCTSLLTLAHLVVSCDTISKHVSTSLDQALSAHRRGSLHFVPSTRDLPPLFQMGTGEGATDSATPAKEEGGAANATPSVSTTGGNADSIKAASLNWVKSARDRELLRRGSPAAQDSLGNRYWELGADCAGSTLWAEDKDGNMLGFYRNNNLINLAKWCDPHRQSERALRCLSHFLASTSAHAPNAPRQRAHGLFGGGCKPYSRHYLREMFASLASERAGEVPFWGQDRQQLAKYSRLLSLVRHGLAKESNSAAWRDIEGCGEKGREGDMDVDEHECANDHCTEALGLLEELLAGGGLTSKWRPGSELRERWLSLLHNCNTPERELYLLHKLCEHVHRDASLISRADFLRRARSMNAEPHAFEKGDSVVVIRQGVREVYEKALGKGWPLPPPMYSYEHCKVARACFRAVDANQKGSRTGATYLWLLLERSDGAGEEASGSRCREGEEDIRCLDCLRVDATGSMVSEWEEASPKPHVETLLVVALPLGGEVPECVVPRATFLQRKQYPWKVNDRVQAIFSRGNQLLAPWNKETRAAQGSLSAVTFAASVSSVSEREDLWDSLTVTFDHNQGSMTVSAWEVEGGPPPPPEPNKSSRVKLKTPPEIRVRRKVADSLCESDMSSRFWSLVLNQTYGVQPRATSHSGAHIDLKELLRQVCARGGHAIVDRKQLWTGVASALEGESSSVSAPEEAGQHLKRLYTKYLISVESALVKQAEPE